MKIIKNAFVILLLLNANTIFASSYCWVNLKVPEICKFSGDSIFGGFSLDLNYSIKHNLLKLSFTYDIEDPFFSMTFISPKLQMSQINISYGYIFNKGRFLFNPDLSIGYTHYIARGDLIVTDHQYMSIGWDNNYEKIEKDEIIYKIILNGNYEISKHIGVGIYFAPFVTSSINGFNTGIYLSFGKLWQSD